MKVSDLAPEQKAELQKRYKDAGLSGPIHLMTVEKVEEKISNALKDEEAVTACKPFDFSVDVFKQVIKKNEEGNEYLAQVPQELEFSPSKDLVINLGGKIPAGQSQLHPRNSFIIKIESEQFVISAELAAKIFKLKG